MLLPLAALSFAFATFLVAEVATAPQRRRRIALKRAAGYGRRRESTTAEMLRFRDRVLAPTVKRLAAATPPLNPHASPHAIAPPPVPARPSPPRKCTQFPPR